MTGSSSPPDARGESAFHALAFVFVFLAFLFSGIAATYGVVAAASVLDTNGYGFAALALSAAAFALLEIVALMLVARWAYEAR